MKKTGFVALATVSTLCLAGAVVSADEVAAPPRQIRLVQDASIGGQIEIVNNGGSVEVVLRQLSSNFSQPTARLWSKSDKSDQLEITEFSVDASGAYRATLDRSAFSVEAKEFYVEMHVKDAQGESFAFETYDFTWSIETQVAEEPAQPASPESQPLEAEESPKETSEPDPQEVDPVQETGFRQAVSSLSPQGQETAAVATGDIQITNHKVHAGTFDVTISNVVGTSDIRMVKVPVWTDASGQDDIIWYTANRQADGTYKVVVDKRQHKNGTGLYHVHLYYRYTNGTTAGIGGTTTVLPDASGRLEIANLDSQAGTFDVVVSNVQTVKSLQTVQIPIWTDANGQDDIVWYTADRQADGTYKAFVDKQKHKNGLGLYHVHLYYRYTDGSFAGITGTTATLQETTGQLTVHNLNVQAGTFDVVVSNVQTNKPLQMVQVPIWTEASGQDDIVWYTANRQADGTYKVSVDKKRHKNGTGLYHAHLYYRYTDGSLSGIHSTTAHLPETTGQLAIQDINAQAGTFAVVVSNVQTSKPLQRVQIPVWADAGGQDDIIWYTADRQTDGTYKVLVDKRQHKNGTGTYHIHLYYRYTDGSFTGISGTTATLPVPKQETSGTLSATNINAQAGTFDVLVSNVRTDKALQSVHLPIWTEAGGQDDIIWYTANRQSDGTYKVSVDKQKHKNGVGLYHVHLYYRYTDGSVAGISGTSVNLPEVKSDFSGKLEIRNMNSQTGSFDIVASAISSTKGVEAIQIPVWSDTNGQDDIVWYRANRQSDGTYLARVEASNHKYSTGTYHAHLYIQHQQGQAGVAATTTNVQFNDTKPRATLSIRNVDNTHGLFEVHISQIYAPQGISKVQVPVWSDANGQNDIRWYDATKLADGSYLVTVRLSMHHYETGLYHAHLYVTTADGKQHGIGATSTQVTYAHKADKSFVDVSSHNGHLSVSDYRHLLSQGVTGVVVKLTEGTSYLNPYAGDQIRNAQAVGLKVSVYHYSHFTDAQSAKAEAAYFAAAGKRFGLGRDVVMVNDIEEHKSRQNVNANMKIWEEEMRRQGYSNLVHYAGASWLDVNGLGYKGPIQTAQFGLKNFWVAQYPYNKMSIEQAKQMSLHASTAAWQFTSTATLLAGRHVFDLNLDYTGRFTN